MAKNRKKYLLGQDIATILDNANENITNIINGGENGTDTFDLATTNLSTISDAASKAQDTANAAMPKTGGDFTGPITIKAPTKDMNPATKKYVDDAIKNVHPLAYVVSTNAADTPAGIVWYSGSEESTKITGTLAASATTEYIIYLVPCKHTAAEESKGYDEYLTVKKGSTYSWEIIGNSVEIDLSNYVNNLSGTADSGVVTNLTKSGNVITVTSKSLYKESPSASGDATAFIDTVSQAEDGQITATKKNIPLATKTKDGLMSKEDFTKLDNLYTNWGSTTPDEVGKVKDVKVNGTSVLDANGVAAITIADLEAGFVSVTTTDSAWTTKTVNGTDYKAIKVEKTDTALGVFNSSGQEMVVQKVYDDSYLYLCIGTEKVACTIRKLSGGAVGTGGSGDVTAALNENIIKDPSKTYLVWKGNQFPNSTRATFKAPAGCTIDWGDGNAETFGTASTTVNTHTYSDGIDYHLISLSNYTLVGNDAFDGCSGLTNVTIGNSVTSISVEAFSNCDSLTDVTIGNSVTSIGIHAFGGCSRLTSITIPNSVASIDVWGFRDCSGLTSVIIGNGMISIGNDAFDGCSGLKTIRISAINSPTLGSNAFETSIEKIIVPKSAINAYKSAAGWPTYADKIVYEVDSSDLSGGGSGDVTAAGNNTFTGTNTFTRQPKFTDGNGIAVTGQSGTVEYRDTAIIRKTASGIQTTYLTIPGGVNTTLATKLDIPPKVEANPMDTSGAANLQALKVGNDTFVVPKIPTYYSHSLQIDILTPTASTGVKQKIFVNTQAIGTYSSDVTDLASLKACLQVSGLLLPASGIVGGGSSYVVAISDTALYCVMTNVASRNILSFEDDWEFTIYDTKVSL